MSMDSPTPEFDRRKAEIMNASDLSNWLKGAVMQLATRDPEDAVKDAQLLLELATIRADEALAHATKLVTAIAAQT